MNNIQIFNNPEFGEIRTIMIDGEPWFVGIDIAKALGYKKPEGAIRSKVDEGDTLKQGVSDSNNHIQQMLTINESGLYALIFGSQLDSAKKFKKWVTSEVLPSIRKTGRIEAKFFLAASFASILVKPIGALPFFVDLWGETEGGKSVSLMLACSVWANPDESQYIGDFKTTDVALEAKADMLNHLPMMLDDTSKTSARIRDNFEGIVYDLCSGKGKSRSNKELGINRENRWRNCILTNGERPLAGYVNQGGAINRILEVECKDHVFSDPQKTASILKQNYG